MTEILAGVGLNQEIHLPKDKRDWVFKRGRALHAAIELDAAGELDESSVHPEIAGRLAAYRKFVRDANHVVIASELELEHRAFRYVGHVDRVGFNVGATTRRAMIDFKSSVDESSVELQLAGYGMAWEDTFPDEPIDDYIALHLKQDGTYIAHVIDVSPHKQLFIAALLVYRALEQRRAKKAEVPV